MANIIVSIISDQTLPNYLFIKEFEKFGDRFLFLSTEEMEKKNKTKAIFETAGIEKSKIRKVLINEDELFKVKKRLDKLDWHGDENHYFVNITGGTKLMSNAVYEYFKQFNSRFFYLPIGRNTVKEIFDDKPASSEKINYEISVSEYLSIYGIDHLSENPTFTEDQVNDIFNDVKSSGYSLDNFPKKKLIRLGIKTGNKQVYTKWFEEFLYYKIKHQLNINDPLICTGLKLFKQQKEVGDFKPRNNDNEIDVFFVHNNNAFIIEAKFSLGKNTNTTALNNALYKLSAVNKRFGINAKATLMTLADFNMRSDIFKESLRKRCVLIQVHEPFDRTKVIGKELFKEELSRFVKGN
jgi:hypothetical protein